MPSSTDLSSVCSTPVMTPCGAQLVVCSAAPFSFSPYPVMRDLSSREARERRGRGGLALGIPPVPFPAPLSGGRESHLGQ